MPPPERRHPGDWMESPGRRHELFNEPAARTVATTERICQLTGEYDRTGWHGLGSEPYAFNRTETCGGIRGTDLGASFEHKNRLYFLFGDTWRTKDTRKTHRDLDAIAYTTDTKVEGGLRLIFNASPPLVPHIGQEALEVPVDGFSRGGRMFVFFSTGYYELGGNPKMGLMGRSVLAVSDDDGYNFSALAMFSSEKFINVSVERATLSRSLAAQIGWEAGTSILWVWGSGAYRASPPYLAVVNLDLMLGALDEGPLADLMPLANVPGSSAFLRFYAGRGGTRWSAEERDARPLFAAGDIGELSCRWNAVFDSYFFMYNSSNPRGIVLRHAPQPWGPWSAPILVFDPGGHPEDGVADGYGRFMHVPWDIPWAVPWEAQHVDFVQDDMFLKGRRDNEWGGEYGPYQISRYTTGLRWSHCDLYFVMSTWNPYQVVLMRTRLTAADLDFVAGGWLSRIGRVLKLWRW